MNEIKNIDSGQRLYFNPITGTIVAIDPAQAWFWSSEWLAGELAVNQELAAGEYEEFDNIDDFIDSL